MKKIVLFCAVFLGTLLPASLFAEGTKQLLQDSTKLCMLNINNGNGNYNCFGMDNCPSGQRMNVRILHPGEVIFFGFHIPNAGAGSYNMRVRYNGLPFSTVSIPFNYSSPGAIQYFSQAVAGPSVLDPHGYPAYKVKPVNAGVYSVNFFSAPAEAVKYFDITVIDTTVTPWVPIEGRLYSSDWGFDTGDIGGADAGALYATQYIYTDDSVVTALSYNGMQGDVYDVTSTRNGCFPPPVAWETSCKSQPGDHHYFQYKIFMNDPDTVPFPSGNMGAIDPNSINVDRMCDGSFQIHFTVNKAGWVKVILDVDPTPGQQPIDVEITDSALFGPNTFNWDGNNGFGEPVPCGDSVGVGFTFVNGLTNIALYDVERHLKGFIIQGVRPGSTVVKTYWNDELVGGGSELNGCLPMLPDTGCHTWPGYYGQGIGDLNTINTWWYAGSSEQVAGFFRVNCVPQTPASISGPFEHCASGFGVYTTDPLPIPGSDSCEWVLTDVSTGTIQLDTIAGPVFSLPYTGLSQGMKNLRARGINTLCGTGEFGPPFQISIIPASHLTNAVTEYTLCTGDSVHIVFQSSHPSTTYSYTATGTSGALSGFSGGNTGRIDQKLVNTGTSIDSVIYRVVPFLDPCYGDTFNFIVRVHPSDEVSTIISPVITLCQGDTAHIFADSSMPGATYEWQVNGIITGGNQPQLNFVPADQDQVQCFISAPEVCNPEHTLTSNSIVFTVQSKKTVTAVVGPVQNPLCKGVPHVFSATGANWGPSPLYAWTFAGNPVADSGSVIAFSPPAPGYLHFRIISSDDCIADPEAFDSVEIQIADSVKVKDTLVCFGEEYFAGGSFQNQPGTYTDPIDPPDNCYRYLATNLSFTDEIMADLGADTTYCGQPFTLDPGVPGASLVWQDSTTNSQYTVENTGLYWVRVTLSGCSTMDSVIISECPVVVYFPTAFTPDGDGLNDLFRPVSNTLEGFSMQIFDRWGKMMYSTGSPGQGWDGTFNGQPCPQGNYAFVATVYGFGGSGEKVRGVVNLIR